MKTKDTKKRIEEILEAYGNQVYSAAPDFHYADGVKFLRVDQATQALLDLIREQRADAIKSYKKVLSLEEEILKLGEAEPAKMKGGSR